jgi:hypothetical protein
MKTLPSQFAVVVWPNTTLSRELFFVPDDRESCCTQNLTLFQFEAVDLSEILQY